MKGLAFFLLMLMLLFTACGQSDDGRPTPAAGTALTLEEPPLAEPSETPAELPAAPTAAGEPPAAQYAGALFHDPFDGRLQDGWQLVPDEPGRYSLENTGYLRLAAGPEFEVPAQALYPVPEGNFQITTLVLFEPSSNFQFAGLTIVAGDEQRMNFGRAFSDCGENPACKGNAIYFDLLDEQGGGPNHATVVEPLNLAYLRLTREGDTFSGYFSPDGVDWQLIGRHTSALVPALAGLITGQAMFEPVTADFDFFALEALP